MTLSVKFHGACNLASIQVVSELSLHVIQAANVTGQSSSVCGAMTGTACSPAEWLS